MNYLGIFFIGLIIQFLVLPLVAQGNSTTKALCYAGSSLYQLVTQDCNAKDSSYTGQWYCAKLEVYEAFQSSSREPIVTRGCATESECFSSTNQMYTGTEILNNGMMPGGMQIVATCCKANSFPDDDTVAIDYSQICNGGSQLQIGLSALFMVVATVFMLM
jgi:hypothetical protein